MNMGAIIQRLNGEPGDLFDPQPEWFDIDTVAHALASKNRWCGQAKVFGYSVAEHSVRVSRLFTDRSVALHGLLHELDEVFLPDMPGPLKAASEMEWYRELCERHMVAGSRAFGLQWPWPTEVQAAVHAADRILLSTETRDLTANVAMFLRAAEPLEERIEPWPAHRAERRFLERFQELTWPLPALTIAKHIAREALAGVRELHEAHQDILALPEDDRG